MRMNKSQQFNTEAKKTIRSNWAKPLLDHLHNKLNKKLIYLGLPDIEANDVKEWLEYIDTVYAFQCRDYPKPSHPEQNRKMVLALEDTLRTLERRRQLSTFDVFDGYIEEVVLRGFDNSPTTKEYIQEASITVYNLDFCGQVTSPIEYVDRNGNQAQAYKFDAVKKLLAYQEKITFPNKKFIMFLTLHCSYDGTELEKWIIGGHSNEVKDYFAQFNSLSKGKKAPYYVKAFVLHNLMQFFTSNQFIPEFLPTIYYKGDNNHPLLYFTIFGTQAEQQSGNPMPFQKLESLLNQTFISVGEEATFVSNQELKLENDIEVNTNIKNLSTHLLKNSKTINKLWG
jgi:hypothetical protein